MPILMEGKGPSLFLRPRSRSLSLSFGRFLMFSEECCIFLEVFVEVPGTILNYWENLDSAEFRGHRTLREIVEGGKLQVETANFLEGRVKRRSLLPTSP